MPNDLLEAALKEAYATARASAVILDTLQVSHVSQAESLFLVSALVDYDLTLETDEVVTFKGCAFRITPPATGENGKQELGLVFDNVNREVSDFMHAAKSTPSPVEITYRPYLLDNLTQPQLKTPLVLYLTDVVVTLFDVSGRASFADIINRPFPARSQIYTRTRFPGLGD
jgi:hypothetical protein